MSDVYSTPPKQVFQNPKKHTCWAATLESWLSVTSDTGISWAVKDQYDAIDFFSMLTDQHDGLVISKDNFDIFATMCGMDYGMLKPAKKLTGNILYSKLKYARYVMLCFAGGNTGLGNGLGHAVLVYELSNRSSQNCTISVMDPWPGMGIRPGQPLSAYRRANEIVLAWRDKG